MIKRILILAAILASGFTQLNAQIKFVFPKDIKINVTASNLLFGNTDGKSSSGIKLSFGNFYMLEINKNFALQGEFMLHYRTPVLSDSTFHCFYSIAKALKCPEWQTAVTINDYIRGFFFIWTYPTCLWFIQPIINSSLKFLKII